MPWTASQQSLGRLSPHASAPFLKLLLRGFGRHRRTARQDPHVVEPEPVEGRLRQPVSLSALGSVPHLSDELDTMY